MKKKYGSDPVGTCGWTFFRLNNVGLIPPLCSACKSVLHSLGVWPSYKGLKTQQSVFVEFWVTSKMLDCIFFCPGLPFSSISLNYQMLSFFNIFFLFLSFFAPALPSFLLERREWFFSDSGSVEKGRERKTAAGEGWVSLWKWYCTCQEDRPQTMVITHNETSGSTDGRERWRRAIDDVYSYMLWTWKPG